MAETIPAMFMRRAEANSRKPLFLVKHQGAYQPITWEEARSDVLALSAFLLSQELKAGDRVVILSENRPEWGIADLAIQSVGGWTVPVYPSLTVQDLLKICNDCQPVIGIASNPEQVEKLLQVARRSSHATMRVLIGIDPPRTSDVRLMGWTQVLATGQQVSQNYADLLTHRREHITPEDTATLIYTSGTTGEPKGVMLSHRNFLSNVEACVKVIPIRHTDLHLSFLPLCHVFERMAGWYLMLFVGACVAYAESMDTVPDNMPEVRPTIMLGVPRFFEKLYAKIQERLRHASGMKRHIMAWALRTGEAVTSLHTAGSPIPLKLAFQARLAEVLVFRKLKARLGGRLRFFVSGSAPLSKELAEFFYSTGITILEGYGLTETSPVIAVNRLPMPRFGSVGLLLPEVEVRIAEDGEILTKGPHVMQGYYQKPGDTAQAIVDGWFHTGDIGHLDAQGYLYITDRKKDLIKTAGGKFISPQKLESLLVTDPYISQVFVFGDKRPYCVALIVPHVERLRRYAQEQEIGSGSIAELVKDPRVHAMYWSRVQAKQSELAQFEQVKKIALLDQEFTQAAGELTPTLKAKRNIISNRYQTLLQQLYDSPTP